MKIIGIAMKVIPKTKQVEADEPVLVPAKVIAHDISCSSRYVHMLYEQGAIPGVRFGKACIRFNRAAVLAALGVESEAGKEAV